MAGTGLDAPGSRRASNAMLAFSAPEAFIGGSFPCEPSIDPRNPPRQRRRLAGSFRCLGRRPKGDVGPEGKPSGDYFALVERSTTPVFLGEHPGFTSVSQPETGIYRLTVEAGVSYYDPIASVEWDHSSGSDLLVEPLGGELEFSSASSSPCHRNRRSWGGGGG
ncbi:MAG TPA: hypothetical protein VMH33_02290, partial [Solirubrobacterales bacterium]|nr:hypothetical protein [Solirubrobacterales bacterium]